MEVDRGANNQVATAKTKDLHPWRCKSPVWISTMPPCPRSMTSGVGWRSLPMRGSYPPLSRGLRPNWATSSSKVRLQTHKTGA